MAVTTTTGEKNMVRVGEVKVSFGGVREKLDLLVW